MTPEELDDALDTAAEGRIVPDLGATAELRDVLEAIGREGRTPELEAAARRAFAEATG